MHHMDYSKLLGRLKERGLRQKDLAHHLGTSESTISQKLLCRYPFTQKEIRMTVDFLEIADEEIKAYFFTEKV